MTERSSAATTHVSSTDLPGAVSPADIRLAAMNLLARREHSLKELRHKLRRRFAGRAGLAAHLKAEKQAELPAELQAEFEGKLEAELEAQLQCLAQENLQSDARFAQSYLRQRAARGYGPLRIMQEMRERGLQDNDVFLAMDETELDWCDQAARVYHKKFGSGAVPDLKEKSRRARFMQYRGFERDHYSSLLAG